MRLLLVEDDTDLAAEISARLVAQRFLVEHSADGEDALHLASTGNYVALVLDLGLPLLDGVSIIKRLREARVQTPILVLTARDRLADKAAAFRAGADDYVTKPFSADELLLRIDALIRRTSGQASSRVTLGDMTFDTMTGLLEKHGNIVRLTALETKVLSVLILRSGQIVPRDEIVEHVYAHDSDHNFSSLEVIVSRLRKKLGTTFIETVRGGGYRLIKEP